MQCRLSAATSKVAIIGVRVLSSSNALLGLKREINLDAPEVGGNYGVGKEGKYKFSVTNAFYGMRGAREPRREILGDNDLDMLTNANYFDTLKFKRNRAIIIVTSLIVFMVYFLYVREESDLDQSIYRPLYVTLPDIEKEVVKDKIRVAVNKGLNTDELFTQLAEIEDEKQGLIRRWKAESRTYPTWMKPKRVEHEK